MRTISRQIMSSLTHLGIYAFALVVILARPACIAQQSPEPTPQLFGENVISTGDDESHPHFTSDGKTLYFLKNTASFNHWTIVVSQEQNRKWTTPEVAPFSGQFSDADPFITADGERFFFISTRPVNGKSKEDTDIWMMKRWVKIGACPNRSRPSTARPTNGSRR